MRISDWSSDVCSSDLRLLGGDGIVQYQVVATLFAAATAILNAGWSARFSGWVAATVAGLFYLVLAHKFSGYGGEAEIFLNLLTTASAWLVARHLRSEERRVGQECVRTGRSRWGP